MNRGFFHWVDLLYHRLGRSARSRYVFVSIPVGILGLLTTLGVAGAMAYWIAQTPFLSTAERDWAIVGVVSFSMVGLLISTMLLCNYDGFFYTRALRPILQRYRLLDNHREIAPEPWLQQQSTAVIQQVLHTHPVEPVLNNVMVISAQTASQVVNGQDNTALNRRLATGGYVCPITQDIMTEPVYIDHPNSSGHRYERYALIQWLQRHDRDPMTNLSVLDTSQSVTLIRDNHLAQQKEEAPHHIENGADTTTPVSRMN